MNVPFDLRIWGSSLSYYTAFTQSFDWSQQIQPVNPTPFHNPLD